LIWTIKSICFGLVRISNKVTADSLWVQFAHIRIENSCFSRITPNMQIIQGWFSPSLYETIFHVVFWALIY
jgi:hypothetical protein